MKTPLLVSYPELDELCETYGGEECIAAYGTSIYFNIANLDDADAGSWHDAAANLSLILSIRYWDEGTDVIQVGYSTDGTNEIVENVVTKTGSGEWMWKHYALASSARMAHSVFANFGNANFRLYCDSELALTNVTLKKVNEKARAEWRITNSNPSLEGEALTIGSRVSGWTLREGYLEADNGNVKINSTLPALMLGAASAFGTGVGIWQGKDAGVYKWRVGDPAGNKAQWDGATLSITGTFYANGGTIGGFTLGADYVRDAADSFGLASTVTGSDDVRFWAGDTFANRATADFRVYESGAVYAGAGIILDAPNQQILVGSGTPRVVIDGANKRIRTSTYAAGLQGFTIESDGSAEFNNIKARGEFHSVVFSYGEVHATAGSLVVSKSAGKLLNDVTTQTSPTTFNVDIKDPDTGHVAVFAASDILRIKDGSGNDNWLTVSSVSDQTTFYRYVCTKSSGTNATFRAGAAVVDYGQSGQGYLEMTADNSDGPYYSVRTHAGSPWSATTERARIGNLKNTFGIGANNYYGFAAGDYANGNYLRYDPTNGFVIKASAGTVALDSDGLHTDILQIDDNALWLGGGASRYRSAGTVADDNSIGTIAWIDTDNVKVKDSSYASVGVTSSQVSHWLVLTNFGFALPSSATVLGIKVDFLGVASDTLVAAGAYARIVKGGTISGSDQVIPFTTTNPPTAYVEKSTASTTDLWSNTWTYADVNSSGFGVALYVNGPDTPSGVILSLDHARISVYYQTASGQVLVQTNSNYFDVLRSASTIDFKRGRALAAGLYDRANSDTTVGNTTTETTLYSKSVTANDLAATGGLRLTMTGTWLNNSGSGKTLTLRVKFGATTIFSYGFTLSSNSSTGRFEIGVTLFNTATNAQVANIVAQYFRGGGSTTLVDGYRNKTTAAEDTTASKTLSVTVQWDAAHANATTTKEMAFLEILP